MRQLFSSLFVIAAFSISAQKMLTVSDAVLKQRNTLAPARLQQINWIPASNNFFYVDMKDKVSNLFIGDAKKGDSKATLTIIELNQVLKSGSIDTLKDFPQLKFTSFNTYTFELKDKVYSYDLVSKKLTLRQ